MNKKPYGLVGLVLAGMAVIVAGCAAPTLAANSDNTQRNTISVVGVGEASGTPDVANIQLGVDVSASDVGQAVSDANETMNRVTESLVEFGIDDSDIQTIGFNVWPEERYDPQSGTSTGVLVYHVQNMVNIKVRDIAQTGKIIEAALSAGANQVYGLSFGIDDTSELEADARADAVADARTRAEQLAAALGMQVGDAIIVAESYGGAVPYPVTDVAGIGGGGSVPISEGSLTVSAAVSVTFELVK